MVMHPFSGGYHPQHTKRLAAAGDHLEVVGKYVMNGADVSPLGVPDYLARPPVPVVPASLPSVCLRIVSAGWCVETSSWN
jgi:hypothetical protein